MSIITRSAHAPVTPSYRRFARWFQPGPWPFAFAKATTERFRELSVEQSVPSTGYSTIRHVPYE